MKIYNVIYNWENDGSGDIEILLSTTDRQKARQRFLEKNLELLDYYKNCGDLNRMIYIFILEEMICST